MAGQTSTDYETYYVPESSKLAILATIGLVTSIFGAATYINELTYGAPEGGGNGGFILMVGLIFFVCVLASWFRITIRENLAGMNSRQLKDSYVLGMQWFIFSEVMFFAAFFGALFYIRTFSGPWLAGEGGGSDFNNTLLWPGYTYDWPMMTTPQQAAGIENQLMANNGEFSGPGESMAFPGWGALFTWLPLWNTIILLSSSWTVHVAHTHLKNNNRNGLNLWLGITVALGIIFLGVQVYEYYHAYDALGLTLEAGAYGTTFFMLTGFHGFHVFMGMTMLLIQWLRATRAGHFTPADHFGFEASSWYWHFVDVVWVGLFLFVYII